MLTWDLALVRFMFSIEERIEVGSDLSAYPANQDGLPSQEKFVSFLANRLRADSCDEFSEVAIQVSRVTKHRITLSGSAKVGTPSKPIQGFVLWLPKLKCFRGHLFIDAEALANKMLAEEANAVRKRDWHRSPWAGNDHDHCLLCWSKISTMVEGADYDFGYAAENSGWLCPKCYADVVLNGGCHPFLEQS